MYTYGMVQDTQQLQRKRHIGNDIVAIVFQVHTCILFRENWVEICVTHGNISFKRISVIIGLLVYSGGGVGGWTRSWYLSEMVTQN